MKTVDAFSLQPNPDCALCNHPQRAAAASMYELGASTAEITTALQLDSASFDQHFARCVPALNDDPRSASDAELNALLNHAVETYHASTMQGNLTASASALSVRLRALAEKASRASAREKRESILDGADPLAPVNSWPLGLQKFLGAYVDDLLSRLDEAGDQQAEYQQEVKA